MRISASKTGIPFIIPRFCFWPPKIVKKFSLPHLSFVWFVEKAVPRDSLWKHLYSNILKNLPPKIEKIQIRNSDIYHISAQNIECGYSLEPPSTHNLCFEQK